MNEEIPKENSIKCEFLKPNNKEYNLKFKVIVIGDSGVGKTCLTINAVKNKFTDEYTSTIGFENYFLDIKINDFIMKFQIWDTCGQERFSPVISSLYKNSQIVILVYSVTE